MKVIPLLKAILSNVETMTKDSPLGSAMHQTAKDATSPANRVKGEAAKAKALA